MHGTAAPGAAVWAHAWVELPGGLVFDGVRQRFYDRAGYYRVLRRTAEAIYRPAEAAARLRATQRYGPWHRGALGDSAPPGAAGSTRDAPPPAARRGRYDG